MLVVKHDELEHWEPSIEEERVKFTNGEKIHEEALTSIEVSRLKKGIGDEVEEGAQDFFCNQPHPYRLYTRNTAVPYAVPYRQRSC